jgi:hypothetical protein
MAPCEVILESGDLVDHAAIAAFQRQAFVNVHGPIAPASVQTSAYYAWKYRTPWGPARVATVTYDGDAASMVAAIPTVFARGLDRWTAWQICDIATAPRLRRRGLMRRGLAALLTNLPTGDGIFCLPNRNSHSLLLQARFQEIGRLSLYVSGAALFTRPHDTATDMTVEPMPISLRRKTRSGAARFARGNAPRRGLPRTVRDLPRLGLAGVSCATLHTCSAPTAAAPHADRGSGTSRLSRALRCSRLGRSLRPIPTTVRFGSRARSRKKSPKRPDTVWGRPPRQLRS